jgi:hypothetical protein
MPVYLLTRKQHASWRHYEAIADRLVIVAPNIGAARELADKAAPPRAGSGTASERPPLLPWHNPDAHQFEMLTGEGDPRIVAIEQRGARTSLGLSEG